MRQIRAVLALLVVGLVTVAACSDGETLLGEHDGAADGDADTIDDGADDDGGADESEADADADADVPADLSDGADAESEAESEAGADADDAGPSVCGNGVVEGHEVCDDGNTVNEACGTTDPAACLADCTEFLATCGNGIVNPGEECDDGDDDSYDDCTTSCAINHHNIGDPCRCTAGCSELDPTAGTIVGCENVDVPADGSAALACDRSSTGLLGGLIHTAEGLCTLMAMRCRGTACTGPTETGDVDRFACPAPFVRTTLHNGRTVCAGGCCPILCITLTWKLCVEPCDGQNDCRWNAVEEASSPWAGECGQFQCLPNADGVNVCRDPQPVL